jgi:MYXO-CTERM domain-containing protein
MPPLPDASAETAGTLEAGSDVRPQDGSGGASDGSAGLDGAAGLPRTQLNLGCACDVGGPARSAGGLTWLLLPVLAAALARRRRRPHGH